MEKKKLIWRKIWLERFRKKDGGGGGVPLKL